MAFTVEQGGKHSAIGCLVSEHDPFKKSFLTGHSSLNKDATVQAADCFVRSAALEPSNKLMTSSPFSLGMSYEQVQDTYDGRGVAGGDSTPDVAPCTPCPSFLQQKSQGQKITKMAHALPSLCLGIGLLEGQQVPCVQRLTTPEKPSSSKEYLQQLSTSSPQSIFITPIQGHEARSELQRETLEPFKEVLISSKLCKHEKYPHECQAPHPVLSLSNFTEMPVLQESPANSRNLRFSFLEALTAGDMQFAQEADFARLPLSEGLGCLQPSSECPRSFESGFASLNQFLDQSKSSTPVFVANTDALVNSLPNAVCIASCPPPVKQEWSKTLKQFPRLYQALSQDKNVAISVCDERKISEKRCKLVSSQENLASRASDKLNVSSSGLPYNNAARQRTQHFEQLNVREALEVASSRKTSDSRGQPLENSFRPVNLAKVKVEIDYEESYGGQYTCGDSVEENDEIDRCNGNPLSEMGFLDSSSAAMYAPPKRSLLDMAGTLQQAGSIVLRNSVCAQLPQVLSTVSAGGPSLCFHNEQSQKPMDLEEQTPPMNRTSQIDGCWGKFLALSANAGQDTMKADTEFILPFQRRFKHLQEFLKQCDTSDEYSLQAFRSLSAAAMSGSAVELETRAVWLSLEEGKELKRMKLLNVLGGKAPEGLHASLSGAVYGPRLPTPGNIVQVKQEI